MPGRYNHSFIQHFKVDEKSGTVLCDVTLMKKTNEGHALMVLLFFFFFFFSFERRQHIIEKIQFISGWQKIKQWYNKKVFQIWSKFRKIFSKIISEDVILKLGPEWQECVRYIKIWEKKVPDKKNSIHWVPKRRNEHSGWRNWKKVNVTE